MVAPVSLIISAFAPVRGRPAHAHARSSSSSRPSRLLLIDLGAGKNRLGGSCWAQVFEQRGGEPADLDDPQLLRALFEALRELKDAGLVLAYHDRSDGGLLVTLLEMAFAGHCGLDVDLGAAGPGTAGDPIAECFAEELGAVLQVPAARAAAARSVVARHGLGAYCVATSARVASGAELRVQSSGRTLYAASRLDLHRTLERSVVSACRRCATIRSARGRSTRGSSTSSDPGLHAALGFDPSEDVAAPYIAGGARPAVAVLREQGVNSQTEMAAVLTRAGFDAYDVHMTDILERRARLGRFHGLVACGGFSYGDVLGAGEGWAKSILFNPLARDEFAAFFERDATFTLGVCNGCQMLAALKELIPGAADWPRFVRNRSEQYEARLVLTQVPRSSSVLFAGMHGSVLPVVCSHGEGLAEFGADSSADKLLEAAGVTLALRGPSPTGRRSAIRTIRTARRRGSPGSAAPTAA